MTALPFRRVALLLAALSIALVAFLGAGRTRVMAQELIVVADDTTDSAVVFNGDTNAIVATIPLPGTAGTAYDVAQMPNGSLAFVGRNNDIYVINLTSNPPSLATGTNPILNPIGGLALDMSITDNGNFLVLSDGAAATPLATINTATRVVVGTITTPDADRNSVEVCDGNIVLSTSNGAGVARKLTISATGTLVDSGSTVTISTPNSTACAPGGLSAVGVARTPGTLVSFLTGSMTPVSTVTLPGAGLGINVMISSDGTKVYGRRATDFVTAYAYNSTTGVIGAQLWSTNVGARPTY